MVDRFLRSLRRGALTAAWAVAALVAPATAQQRIVDWNPGKGAGWSLSRSGPAVAASLRTERGPDGPELVVDLDSGNDKPVVAQPAFRVDFVSGHRYRITLELAADADTRAVLLMRRTEKPYEPMIQRTVQLTAKSQRVELEGVWPYIEGTGEVRLSAIQPKARLRVRSLLIDDLGEAALGQLPVVPFARTLMGIHVNKLDEHKTWLPLGAGLVRLWDTRTNWNHLGPTPEEFDAQSNEAWRRLDRHVDYVMKNDRQALILMTLGQPPRWASASPDAKCPYGQGTCGAPKNIDDWRHYVRTLATRYKGRIRHWELWNEPNYSKFFVPTRSLVELARVAREELKAVDPANALVSPGYTSWGVGWLEGFLREGGGQFVDLIGFHWYYGGKPERLAPMIQNVRRTLAQYGADDKPLWVTEGAPQCEPGGAGGCRFGDLSADEVDTVPERAILTMWLNGVQAYGYYTIEGLGGRGLALLDTKSKRATVAGTRFAEFGRWMGGARAEEIGRWGASGHWVRARAATGPFYVVWTEGGAESFEIPAAWAAKRATPLGVEASATPADGRLSVTGVPVMLQ